MIEFEKDGDGESIVFGSQRTDVCGERSGEHVDSTVDEIHRSGSFASQSIQRGIDSEIVTDIGDMNTHFVMSIDLAERTGVIDVYTADWIDANHIVSRSDVLTTFQIALINTFTLIHIREMAHIQCSGFEEPKVECAEANESQRRESDECAIPTSSQSTSINETPAS